MNEAAHVRWFLEKLCEAMLSLDPTSLGAEPGKQDRAGLPANFEQEHLGPALVRLGVVVKRRGADLRRVAHGLIVATCEFKGAARPNMLTNPESAWGIKIRNDVWKQMRRCSDPEFDGAEHYMAVLIPGQEERVRQAFTSMVLEHVPPDTRCGQLFSRQVSLGNASAVYVQVVFQVRKA